MAIEGQACSEPIPADRCPSRVNPAACLLEASNSLQGWMRLFAQRSSRSLEQNGILDDCDRAGLILPSNLHSVTARKGPTRKSYKTLRSDPKPSGKSQQQKRNSYTVQVKSAVELPANHRLSAPANRRRSIKRDESFIKDKRFVKSRIETAAGRGLIPLKPSSRN